MNLPKLQGHRLRRRKPHPAIDYWKQGGLVEVNVHLPEPNQPACGGLRDKDVDITALVKDGTPANVAWLHELDKIAAGLQQLNEAGVVVLWRSLRTR